MSGNKNKSPSGVAIPPPPTPKAVSQLVKKRVFIIDDHPIVRQGLVQLLESEPDLVIVGQGEDAYVTLPEMRAAKPDLVLLDISLKNTDGLELMKELKSQGADFPVLILSMHDETLYAERALRSGAHGYIMKQEPPAVLLSAIRKVLSGDIYISPNMGATLLQRMVGGKPSSALATSPMERLTDRELEVFRMIGAGDTIKEIAERLCLSPKTVEAHREHIKEKLNLKTSAQLLRFAIRETPESN
jgi:DNA-binding NarL/FixJ family response regulator